MIDQQHPLLIEMRSIYSAAFNAEAEIHVCTRNKCSRNPEKENQAITTLRDAVSQMITLFTKMEGDTRLSEDERNEYLKFMNGSFDNVKTWLECSEATL